MSHDYPTLAFEIDLWASGYHAVAGLDEVGRGAWAGPVTVCAVIPATEHLSGIRDSKMLTPEQRDKLATLIAQHQAKFQNQF